MNSSLVLQLTSLIFDFNKCHTFSIGLRSGSSQEVASDILMILRLQIYLQTQANQVS